MADARAPAAEGKRALSAGETKRAADLFDRAIAVIDNYGSENILEDSGMALAASQAEARKSNWTVAANLKESVVETRLQIIDGKLSPK